MRHLLAILAAALPFLVAAGPVAAQLVPLEMRPHAGDTVRLRFDQRTEMTATRREPDGERSMTVVTDVTVHTTAVVLEAGRDGAKVAASTDSASVRITPDPNGNDATLMRRRLEGQRVLLELEPNGKTHILQSGGMPSPELSALFARMPALLPAAPVPVGGSWSHTVAIPVASQGGSGGNGTLRAAFRLDSISSTGDLAFISMSGSIVRSPVTNSARRLSNGVLVETSGTVAGRMTVDRRLGWISEAEVEVHTVNTYTPPPESTAAPMKVTTKSTQSLRQVDKP